MCKAPIEGNVKTRLMTQYSAKEATAWHRAMATTVIQRAHRLFLDVTVASDDITHPFFTPFDVSLLPQGEGNLGARMIRMMSQVCKKNEAIMFLGTDSPHISDERLMQVHQGLQNHDVVLGAVEDGGYDLIAMRQPYIGMLQGIDWGTEKVLQQSIQTVKTLGLSYQLLDVSFDVDTPDMLARAIKSGWKVTFEELQ